MKEGSQDMLYGKKTFSAEIVGLRVRVSPNYIAAFVALKIPRRNKNNVAFSDPDASFHFAANTAQPFFAVLALNQNAIETEQFNYHAQNFAWRRIYHLADFAFA